MLKLYGAPISNFYSIARQALFEKGVAFEEVQVMPNQEPAYLAKSPMGKIPALETDKGFLTETSVILDYIEDLHPTPNLYPADPFERARVKQMIKNIELYVETPAHGMVMALFGQPVEEHQSVAAKQMMVRGLNAFKSLAKFSPWLCGDQFTYADIFAYHSFGLVINIGAKVYDWDVSAEVPNLKAWQQRVAQRPVTQRIDGDTQAAMKVFLQQAG